jgi:pseudouridine synthase
LDRALSRFGFASRTVACTQILKGSVSVNGRIERNPESWVDLRHDRIAVRKVPLKPAPLRYYVLNKPKGVITSRRDKLGRKTVFHFLPDRCGHISAVGRLDKNTSGLLLLTNDNSFAHFLTAPESKVPKTYLTKVRGKLSQHDIEKLQKGISLSDGPTLPSQAQMVRASDRHSWVQITIHEGRNRQVRRMFEAIDHIVLKLVRIQIGNLALGDLKTGQMRELTRAELRDFFSYSA